MSVQFPQLDFDEQRARFQDLGKNTLFPYSYPFAFGPTSLVAANTVSWFSGSYMTVGFQADNNLAVSALEVEINMLFVNNTAKYTGFFGIEVSYSPVANNTILSPSGAPPALPTPVPDIGNIIYRNMQWANVAVGAGGAGNSVLTILNIDDFRRYEPYNYLLKFNQILYFHFFFDSSTLGAGLSTIVGTITLHTLATGLKI